MHFAMDRKIQFLYASSASTYGSGQKDSAKNLPVKRPLMSMLFPNSFLTTMPAAILTRRKVRLRASGISTSTDPRKTTRARWLPWYARCSFSGRKTTRSSSLANMMAMAR